MLKSAWLVDAILYAYALSLLFSFSDAVQTARRGKRTGTGLLVFVWVLESLFFPLRMMDEQALPVISLFEASLLFSWFLLTLSIVLQLVYRMGLIVFLINVIGFAVLAFNGFAGPDVKPTLAGWRITDELLFVHVSLAVAAYAAFALSAVCSGSYLYIHRRLKHRQWSRTVKRLPSLEKADELALAAAVGGLPLLVLSSVLGMVWLYLEGRAGLWLDPKVLNSLIIIGAYSAYLIRRLTSVTGKKELAWWNFAAFAVVVVNFILSNSISGFHNWVQPYI